MSWKTGQRKISKLQQGAPKDGDNKEKQNERIQVRD